MGQPALNRSRAAWPRELRSVSAEDLEWNENEATAGLIR